MADSPAIFIESTPASTTEGDSIVTFELRDGPKFVARLHMLMPLHPYPEESKELAEDRYRNILSVVLAHFMEAARNPKAIHCGRPAQ